MPKLCVALDTDKDTALRILDRLSDYPLVFKVGHRLFIPEGRSIVERIKAKGFELFLDLKFHDIPNTVALAVKAAEELGVDYLTLHSLGGKEMLERASSEAKAVKLLGVSILTSHDEGYLGFLRTRFRSIRDMVLYLARVSLDAGLQGVVCSGEEVGELKESLGRDFEVVVPGIRLRKENSQDQKRVLTPKEALRRGADMLVMGREILGSPRPEAVVEEVLRDISRYERT